MPMSTHLILILAIVVTLLLLLLGLAALILGAVVLLLARRRRATPPTPPARDESAATPLPAPVTRLEQDRSGNLKPSLGHRPPAPAPTLAPVDGETELYGLFDAMDADEDRTEIISDTERMRLFEELDQDAPTGGQRTNFVIED